jgi:antitoxin MazE
MQARVQKWGNSLALRIPHAFAVQAGVQLNSSVDIELKDGCIVLRPRPPDRFELSDLLDKINDSNLHTETDVGTPVGNESW